MATEVHLFTATIPANTPESALAIVKIPLDNRELESLDLLVPAGPAGLMGFYIARSGTPVFPLESNQFFVWDDVFKTFPTSEYPTASGWEVHGYNLDVNDHAVTVGMNTNYPNTTSITPPVLTIISQPAMGDPVVL